MRYVKKVQLFFNLSIGSMRDIWLQYINISHPPFSPHSSYTSIADNTNGRRREDENSLLQQSQLPENKDVWTKELEVLSDGSSWMDHLSGEREREQ